MYAEEKEQDESKTKDHSVADECLARETSHRSTFSYF